MKISTSFLKLLLCGNLLYIAAAQFIGTIYDDEQQIVTTDYRLPNDVVPLYYNMKLLLYDHNEISTMEGESNITIEVRRETSKISLHMMQMSLIHVMLIGTNYQLLEHSYNSGTNIVTFYFNGVIQQGIYTLYIKYSSYLFESKDNSAFKPYINQHDETVLQIATFSRPCWVRRLFPCWDEPAFQAIFNISIKHRTEFIIVSNMPTEAREAAENGMSWTHFYETIPTPAYRLSLVIGMSNIVYVSDTNETVYLWCDSEVLPDISFAFYAVEQLKNKLDWHARSSYKMQKLDLLGIANFNEQSIGNWGTTLYRQSNILYNEDYDDSMKKMDIARLVGRAIAYQWLDNAFTPSWWSDIWLNEGLAILFQMDILNKTFPEWRIPDLFVVQTQHECFHLDVNYNMMPLICDVKSPFEINSLLSSSFYIKAPVIIRMLQHIITNVKVNPNALYQYLNVNQFNASSVSFWTAIQASVGSNFNTNYNLSSIMNTWTMYQLYPILMVTRNYTNGQITISQRNNILMDKNKWWIPLTYTTQKSLDFFNTSPEIWLRPQSHELTLGELFKKDEWVIFNLQQTGYYRVNYDIENWKLIARFLNEEDYTKIHVLNRAQIIDDAYYFMVTRQLPLTTFLELTNYLSRETDYIAWYPMIKALEKLSIYLPYKENGTLQKHVQKILNALLLKLGYDEDEKEDDLIKCLRQEAAKWACTLNDVNCKNVAYEKALIHLEDTESLSPRWGFWAYCHGLQKVQTHIWDYEISFESGVRKLIELFHCPGVSIVNHHLHTMNINKIIKSTNIPITMTIYSIVSNAKINLKTALELLSYFNTRFVVKTLNVLISRAYSQIHLNEINRFAQYYLQKKNRLVEIAMLQDKIRKQINQIKYRLKKLKIWNAGISN